MVEAGWTALEMLGVCDASNLACSLCTDSDSGADSECVGSSGAVLVDTDCIMWSVTVGSLVVIPCEVDGDVPLAAS